MSASLVNIGQVVTLIHQRSPGSKTLTCFKYLNLPQHLKFMPHVKHPCLLSSLLGPDAQKLVKEEQEIT